jgi:hypothetical protein
VTTTGKEGDMSAMFHELLANQHIADLQAEARASRLAGGRRGRARRARRASRRGGEVR